MWERVPRNYFFIFFLCSRSLGFLFAVPNFTDGFKRPSNSEMKLETNFISIVTYLSYVALKWCMTSPSHINRLFLHRCFWVWISFEAAFCCSEVYVVLALFMLMGTIQKPTLCSYFSKKLYFGDSNLWFYYFYGSV